jgi:hypothetical protein
VSYEDKLTKARDLIGQRDEIDAKLAELFGEQDKPRRGRPPTKKNGPTSEADPPGTPQL